MSRFGERISGLRTHCLESWRVHLAAMHSQLQPTSYERTVDSTINQILIDSLQQEYEAFNERDSELFFGIDNKDRQKKLYYPTVRRYTEKQNSLFRTRLPFEYSKALEAFGSHESSWGDAIRLAQNIQDQLHIGTPEQGGIIDCRAKSLLSRWLKMRGNNLDQDEIFDGVGVRVTCVNIENARIMHESLLAQNVLMTPHKFRHRDGQEHQPNTDNLDSQNENGFASIRMNFIDEKIGPYEVQIQTLENYMVWRRHEIDLFAQNVISPVISPKYGLLIDPE